MSSKDNGKNPWLNIPAGDYEGHMGPDGVDQLSVLDKILDEIYADIKPRRMVVLGCGTGNGFRHVDGDRTTRLVGVDINSAYLEIARARYAGLGDTLELCCFYAEKCTFEPGSFDLVHSALVLEYLDPEPMIRKIASWLAPGGTASFVIQEPAGDEEGPVSATPFTSLMVLAGAMRLLSPEVLGRLAVRNGLKETRSWKEPLKHDKQFYVARYIKE